MDHRQKLLEVYYRSNEISDIGNLPDDVIDFLNKLTSNIDRNKGVYTVLVTLFVHKLLYPNQDIRFFQDKMKSGFSARSVDTKYITPTLKELGLPSMAESGWLTRSLEQPYPYTLDYKGEISGKGMKGAFLGLIDKVQKTNSITENILRVILFNAIQHKKKNKVEIVKIAHSDEILISTIINILEKHFTTKYNTHGGSKLPVLAFHAVYTFLINELSRYKGCILSPLSSHTASDRTSNTAGDVEILRNKKRFEVVEIKLDRQVDITIARVAYEKIIRFNPERYYILSNVGTSIDDRIAIDNLISEVQNNHGCQLIINGLLQTLKYYLRLLADPKLFLNEYIQLVEEDNELKVIHKATLKLLVNEFYRSI